MPEPSAGLPEKIHSRVLEDLCGLGAKQLINLSSDGTLPARVGRAEYPCAETIRRLIQH